MANFLEQTITDLFGNNITSSSLFLIINSNNVHKLLKKLAKEKTSSIWTYDRSIIDQIIEQHRLDPKNYLILGDVLYIPKYPPKQLILVHKNLCKLPTQYLKIISYADGAIYKPISNDNNYNSIGLLFSKNLDTLDKNIGLIPQNIILTLKNPLASDNLAMNDFNLLSTISNNVFTIKRTALLKNKKHMKISNIDGLYITKNNTNAKIKNKLYSEDQTVTYNTQGELIIDGKCLTLPKINTPNPELFFDTCNNNDNQKWNMYQGQIMPQSGKQQCLTSNDNNLSISNCTNSDAQTWDTEDDNINTSSDYSWDTYKGKTVVLVESDNPWYINTGTTVMQKIHKSSDNLNVLRPTADIADFKSAINLDVNKPDLGLGHSYASRLKKIENFESMSTTSGQSQQNNFILIICIIIIFLLIYKHFKQ